jgi:hypothetical protein
MALNDLPCGTKNAIDRFEENSVGKRLITVNRMPATIVFKQRRDSMSDHSGCMKWR